MAMIKFFDLAVEEAAVDQIKKNLMESGCDEQEAARVSDAAGSLCLSIFRGMDASIQQATGDEDEQELIQMAAMRLLMSTAKAALHVYKVRAFNKMFRR